MSDATCIVSARDYAKHWDRVPKRPIVETWDGTERRISGMRASGYEHWTNVVGIRADEPRRIAKMRGTEQRERWDIALPLVDAMVTLGDVTRFWAAQDFDLALRPHEGNCDCCFLKGYDKIKNIVRDRPDLAAWWAEQERRIGGTFRADRPSYAAMLAQPDLFTAADESLTECFCTD